MMQSTNNVFADIVAKSGTRLGFGCAWIRDAQHLETSERILDAALERGMTYFDTARLYGEGVSEPILGRAIAKKRDKLVITSKAGILPTPNSLMLRASDKLANMARKAPGMKSIVPEPKKRQPIFGVFAPADVRASLEQSLEFLKTDYLDLFLLHDCQPNHAQSEDLRALIEDFITEGKIRAWGIATGVEQSIDIARSDVDGPVVMQFAHSEFNPSVDKVRAATDIPFILHSVLAGGFREFMQAIVETDQLNAMARDFGFDPDNPPRMAARLLAAALHDNPDGIVLFSTSRPENLEASLQAADIGEEEANDAKALAQAFLHTKAPISA